MKFHPISGGFRCTLRGNVSIQEVWVYVRGDEAQVVAVQAKISDMFD